MFENEEIMLIDGLPPSRISTMLGEGKIEDFNSTPPKLLLIRKPLLGTQFYHFNLLQEEFKDVRVRKAFNYAINKGAIEIGRAPSELQSRPHLVCRLLLEKKKKNYKNNKR